ncbi:MAG: serine/threonine protein kinase [Planctomycetes bacterium]|nr:serine/threonine protein kinase [Planctomycetota bacterium]
MTELVWELDGQVRGARGLPLGARLDVGGAGAEWALVPEPAGWLVLDHRLGGVCVEAAEGVLQGQAPLRPGAVLVGDATFALGPHVLRLRHLPAATALPQVAGYAVEALLGSGGSGQVFAGVCLADGERVALKVLDPEADALTAARFRREVELAAALRLPGVARVRGLVEEQGRVVLVRELIDGPTLAERLREGALEADAALELGVALGDALGGVHAAGIVHRDLKPANVVLGPGGPVLIDFDLARRCGPAHNLRSLTRLTHSGAGLGSLAYLPPEQLRAAHEADARADVYGLGAVLYHALSGAPPFADVEPEDFLAALEAGPRPLPAAGLPPGLSAILARATAPAPAARYADGAAFAQDLRAARGWRRSASQWTLTLEAPPAGEPPPEVLDALRDHPGHLRIDLGRLQDPDGGETARLVSFLRAIARVARPPVILVRAPQATAHTLYKVGIAPKFALDDPRTDQAYPG